MSIVRKWWGVFPVLLCGLLAVGCWAQFRQSQLASRMVRLHVVANSDSDEDQTLKLQVRDAVLERCQELLAGSDSVEDTRETLKNALPNLAAAGLAVVEEQGYDCSVTVSLEYTNFPTIDYGDFSLPAGDYQALRVELGEGEGHNWWCVLFPGLCLEPVSDLAQSAMAEGLTEEDVALLTKDGAGYELRFRILELLGSICN
ncbi:MAG: stage II sporulation protein R [Clostridiales bacterium]|nr:stage II sporulation protein R [Clostridiales bacterium]